MIKFLWIDTETTGLDPVLNDIIQLSGILEIPGVRYEEFDFRVAPINYDSITEDAMKCNGIKLSTLKKYPPASEVHLKFKQLLFKWVNPFDPKDKLILCGQNVLFDMNFLQQFCEKQGDKFLRSCITSGTFDLRTLSVAYEIFLNKKIFHSYSLANICEILGVELKNAHNALNDIRATRECCLKIWNIITK